MGPFYGRLCMLFRFIKAYRGIVIGAVERATDSTHGPTLGRLLFARYMNNLIRNLEMIINS